MSHHDVITAPLPRGIGAKCGNFGNAHAKGAKMSGLRRKKIQGVLWYLLGSFISCVIYLLGVCFMNVYFHEMFWTSNTKRHPAPN